MKLFFTLLLLSLPIDALFSQVNPELKKSVAFVFQKNKNDSIVAIGTGFFVGVRNEVDSSRLHVYFVTAKHVIRDSNKKFFNQIFLRMNTRTGVATTYPISLFSSGVPIFTISQDTTVDIAVLTILPNIQKFDFLCIPAEMIASRDIIQKKTNPRRG